MNNVSNKLIQVILYVFSYASIVGGIIASGYILMKDNDEDNKQVAKIALILLAIFITLSALLALFYYIFIDLGSASHGAIDFYSTSTTILNIAKIVVFTIFAILALFGITLKSQKNN